MAEVNTTFQSQLKKLQIDASMKGSEAWRKALEASGWDGKIDHLTDEIRKKAQTLFAHHVQSQIKNLER